jgi:hypothetical protein
MKRMLLIGNSSQREKNSIEADLINPLTTIAQTMHEIALRFYI